MGTISEKLTYLNETKQELKQKINNLGGSITDETTFRQYVDQLDGVYDVLPKTEFQEGTSVTIEGGLKGKIDFDDGKVGFGQASQESTNGYQLMNLPTFSQTQKGVKVEYINGVIKISGTVSESGWVFFTSHEVASVESGQTYTYSLSSNKTATALQFFLGCEPGAFEREPTFGSFDLSSTNPTRTKLMSASSSLKFMVFGNVTSGTTYNLEVKPMLEKGSTAHTYEPYTGGYASPSPNWEQPIQCVTGNQSIVESGKNLFEPVLQIDDTDINLTRCTAEVINGVMKFTATAVDWYFGDVTNAGSTWTAVKGLLMEVKEGETYNIVLSNTNIVKNYITYYDKDKKSLGNEYKSTNSFSFTASTGVKYISLRIGLGNATIVGTTYETTILVAKGNDTTYEPYHTPRTYQFSLGNNKFYNIGDYADELLYDVDEDKVYKKEKIGEITFNGGETGWNITNNVFYIINTSILTTSAIVVMSNYFVGATSRINSSGVYNNNPDNSICCCSSSSIDNRFFVKTSSYTTLDTFKEWLRTHNLKVRYVLATPTLTELTDETLKTQVKDWYYSQSFNGTTILESNGDLPMIIKVRTLKGE